MLKIFKTNIPLQVLLIVVTTLLLWGGALIYPHPLILTGGGPLYNIVINMLNARVASWLAFVLVLTEGFLLNSVLYDKKMIPQNTLLPMLFYVMAMSMGPNGLTVTPMLLANLMMILCINQLMLTGTLLSLTFDKTFGTTMSISLAAMFCPAYLMFFVPMLINIFTYGLYRWKDLTMILLGALAPIIVLETYYYVTDQLFYANYLQFYDLLDLHLRIGGSLVEWIGSSLFVVWFVYALVSASNRNQNHVVNYQKNTAAISMQFLGGALALFYTKLLPIDPQFFAIAFAFLAAAHLLSQRRVARIWDLLIILMGVFLLYWNNLTPITI